MTWPLQVPECPECDTLQAPVLKVFDGDGFLTSLPHPRSGSIEVGVRFGFTDAPEMAQPGGREARDFLSSLIAGQWLELVLLTKMDTGQIFDRHRRLVCIPYLTQRAVTDPRHQAHLSYWAGIYPQPVTRNVELEMVLNGWAWVLERYGPDERYLEALDDARRHRRGIWAKADNIEPWEFKRQQYARKPKARGRPQQLDLLAPEDDEVCPTTGCSGHLRRRIGRYGPFCGCSNFPACRYTRSVS